MFVQALVSATVGCGVAVLVALAEMLHARRVRRVGRLAFGPEQRPRPWTKAVPLVRCLCLGVFAWAITTLIITGSGLLQPDTAPVGSNTRHLVFIADLSPSMMLADAGPENDVPRRVRMAEVAGAVMDRAGGDVSFSVIAFYNNALPVVLQVRDRAVVRNVFDGMPLTYALGKGKTDLSTSLSRAMEILEPFPKSSTSVFICTDGDTVPLAHLLTTPGSVRQVMVLGVGDTEKGTFIDGHQSRQDADILRTIAAWLGGEYLNVNDRHVPTAAMGDLVPGPGGGRGVSVVDIAIWAMFLTASILAVIPIAQQYAGTGWRVRLPSAPSRSLEGV